MAKDGVKIESGAAARGDGGAEAKKSGMSRQSLMDSRSRESKATYRIEWFQQKDGDYGAAAVCEQNGEEVWRQSEGLRKPSEVMRRVADLFNGRWKVVKRVAARGKGGR